MRAVADSDDTFESSVHARMASHVGEGPEEPVDDVERVALPGDPPVPGAQWDEVHHRWEVWDEDASTWRIVGDAGDGVPIADENPLPPLLARELLHAEEVEAAHLPVSDVDRSSPVGPAPRGAQWNEIEGRWERWDEATEAWVEATVDDDPAD
jgi:hypothetical protein